MTLYGLTETDVRTLRQMAHAFRTGSLNLAPFRRRSKGGGGGGGGLAGLFTPCRCTVEDSGGAGLHTFSQVDWAGGEVTDGKVIENVWCAGDFNKDWDLDTGFTDGTFGLVFKVESQNVALLSPVPSENAYYVD